MTKQKKKMASTISNISPAALQILKTVQEKKAVVRRPFLSSTITFEDYCNLIKTFCEAEFAERNEPAQFIINEQNTFVIKQLYYYSIGSKLFVGNPKKGIILSGNFGTGKTSLMLAFCKILNTCQNYTIELSEADKLISFFDKETMNYPKVLLKPLFINELGRETKENNIFGNVTYPFISILDKKYENGSFIYATSNFSIETLCSKYGEFAAQRIRAMFNFLELKGTSFRPVIT